MLWDQIRELFLHAIPLYAYIVYMSGVHPHEPHRYHLGHDNCGMMADTNWVLVLQNVGESTPVFSALEARKIAYDDGHIFWYGGMVSHSTFLLSEN